MHTPVSLLALVVAFGASVTAILPSSWTGESSARKELERRGVAPDSESLLNAAQRGDSETARLLLEIGVEADAATSDGRTVLMVALQSGMPDVAEQLILHDAALGAVDDAGTSVLGHAVQNGEISIVTELLARGVSPDASVAGGGSVIAEAVKWGRTASAKLLLDSGGSKWAKSSDGASMIFHATNRGTDWLVKRLIDGGVPTHFRHPKGDSLVHTVVRGQHADMLPILWKGGAHPDWTNAEGETALHVALREEKTRLVPDLLDHGASPEFKHPSGWLPLHLAVHKNDDASVKALLKHGADVSAAGVQGTTAMQLVLAKKYSNDLLAALLEAGANPDTRASDGRCALDVYLARRDFAGAQLFLDHKAEASTALHNAVVEGDRETFDLLMKNEVDPNGPTADSALVTAVRAKQIEMVVALLQAGADVERPGREKQAALHFAVALNDNKMVEVLLKGGADPNVPYADPVGDEFLKYVREIGYLKWQMKKDSRISPLMAAADAGNHEMAKLLMDHGAKRHAWTKKRTMYPIGFAARRDDVKMMQILLERDPEAKQNWVKVDLSQQRAWLYNSSGKTIYTTKISSGKKGFRTRTGEFVITNKTRHHVSNIYEDAKMPYFQRLSCGDFGFHQGHVPGYPASHGCLRVPYAGAAKLWKLTKTGDRVVIVP